MKKGLILLSLLLVASCNGGEKPADKKAAEAEAGAPAEASALPPAAEEITSGVAPEESGLPPMPPYQMRDPMPPGDRTAPGRDGKALYSRICGYCHLAGGMGTNVLTARMLATGLPPQEGLLENRTDLQPQFVKTVVRNGQGAMPPQTRVDVTDAELDAIAAYLSGKGQ